MKSTVDFLCSPACLPRNPGKEGGLAARDYLRDRLQALRLTPIGEQGFDQPIPSIGGSNLLGVIPGNADAYVLLAAHYDACLDNNPGADDNAAAVAVVLEVAGRLQEESLDRSVIIALFDAEEPPYFLTPNMGSQWFVDHPTVPLDQVDMMICLDLVGHALGPEGFPPEVRNSIFVLGAEKSTGTGALIDALPEHDGIRPRRIDNYIIDSMSDYDAFMNAGVPFLFYSAGRWEHYHQPTDTPDKLDFEKMAALAKHLTDTVAALANRDDQPEYVPDGHDDEATIFSLEDILAPLSEVSPDAEMAAMFVGGIKQSLESNGVLNNDERGAIAMIVDQIEGALA
ncbi:MAG: M28 family peptidase [Acidobacteriota bacterium]